jgi:fucose permease
MLFLFVIPYGLGAGSVDSALNNYVAKHYSSSVMNFLHCFYGVGAMISPYIMSFALSRARWNEGYRWTAYIQSGIMLVCLLSFPLWKKNADTSDDDESDSTGIISALKIRGVIPTLIAFYAYCSGEATCFLWTSSYFVGAKQGISTELAAAFGSLIFGGLMLGRLISAFVSNKLGDRLLIRIGIAIEVFGILLIFLPLKSYIPAAVGFVITGIGMGPVYPAIQHMAPENFGRKNSAAVIGLQMASAYIGSTFMPMVFGLLQQALGIAIMPMYLAFFALLSISLLEFAYKRIPSHTTV